MLGSWGGLAAVGDWLNVELTLEMDRAGDPVREVLVFRGSKACRFVGKLATAVLMVISRVIYVSTI